MKLDDIKIIIDIQERKIFEYPHLSNCRELFDQCMSWIGVNSAGSCCVELCPLEEPSRQVGDTYYYEPVVRFFTLDGRGKSPLIRGDSPIYALGEKYNSQEIFFALKTWVDTSPIAWRMSIDWYPIIMKPRGPISFVPFEHHVNLEMSRFVLRDRFYIMERT